MNSRANDRSRVTGKPACGSGKPACGLGILIGAFWATVALALALMLVLAWLSVTGGCATTHAARDSQTGAANFGDFQQLIEAKIKKLVEARQASLLAGVAAFQRNEAVEGDKTQNYDPWTGRLSVMGGDATQLFLTAVLLIYMRRRWKACKTRKRACPTRK